MKLIGQSNPIQVEKLAEQQPAMLGKEFMFTVQQKVNYWLKISISWFGLWVGRSPKLTSGT
jgi:hypothetical protein